MHDERMATTITRLEMAVGKIIQVLIDLSNEDEVRLQDLDLGFLRSALEVYSNPSRYIPAALAELTDNPGEGEGHG